MHETGLDRTGVLRPVVIDVGGEPLGVVVPHQDGFRFLAVKLPAFALDGEIFSSVEAARAAASRVLGEDAA